MKNIIVTIDGWSSCGKSTLAKQLAKALGYVFSHCRNKVFMTADIVTRVERRYKRCLLKILM